MINFYAKVSIYVGNYKHEIVYSNLKSSSIKTVDTA